MFRYFVSFKSQAHTGNSIVELNRKLDTAGDIRALEQQLADRNTINDVQLLNFILIYEDDKPAENDE